MRRVLVVASLVVALDTHAIHRDADPTKDPPLAGAGPEACAICHYE